MKEVTRVSGGQMRIRWTDVACRGRGETHTRCWWGNLREKEQWKDRSVYGRIILKLMLKKSDGTAWIELGWSRIAAIGGPL